MRSLSPIGLDPQRKYRNIWFTKSDHLGFSTLYFWLSFFHCFILDVSFFFYALNVSGLQVIFVFSNLFIFIMKLQKFEHPKYQIGTSGFPSIVKFGHQHMLSWFVTMNFYESNH
jgi:hypothetical protein